MQSVVFPSRVAVVQNDSAAIKRPKSSAQLLVKLTDVWTGEILTIKGGVVYWNDISSSRGHGQFQWLSKIFQTPNKRNFGAARIYFSLPSETTASLTFKFYADGLLKSTQVVTSSGQILRLPSGYKADYLQIELSGNALVYSVEIANTAKELLNV